MATKENNAYILGTERAEMHRLGFQHQVWASEARQGWKNAGFTYGDTILDLGCGPGFCTRELAFMVGPDGKAIGIDKSPSFIKFLEEEANLHGLDIKVLCSDFDNMELETNSLDGVYCRWAMAWIPNVEEIITKLHGYLKPGGTMVFHEYYDWSTLQTEPSLPNLKDCISGALASFHASPGNIDIGRRLPEILESNKMDVTSVRPMTKLARPQDLEWNWPRTFFQLYFPKVAEMGFLTTEKVGMGLQELDQLGQMPGATILCPLMVEVIGTKM